MKVEASSAGGDPGRLLPAVVLASGGLVSSAPALGLGLTLPPHEDLGLLRQTARRDGTLKDLRQMVAAWEAVAARCDLAFEELVRLAVFRLEVERDLGSELAQTVRHGGDRSRSSRATLLDGALPPGITKQQAAKYRALAGIPQQAFQDYLAESRKARKVPNATAARRFVRPARPKADENTPRLRARQLVVPSAILDAISSHDAGRLRR
jgi:hypothetical protein